MVLYGKELLVLYMYTLGLSYYHCNGQVSQANHDFRAGCQPASSPQVRARHVLGASGTRAPVGQADANSARNGRSPLSYAVESLGATRPVAEERAPRRAEMLVGAAWSR